MRKRHTKPNRIFACVCILLACASLLRYLGNNGTLTILFGWLRGAIQCALLAAWAVSLHQRILQANQRKYLQSIAVLLFFWLAERTVKYMLLGGFPTLSRYFWYLYYIPMELVPLIGLFAVLCMGKPDNYKLPPAVKLLYIPAFVMIAIVLTNDLHEKMFAFPNGFLTAGSDYTYGPLAVVVVGWIYVEIAAFLCLLFRKSRLPHKGKRLLLPFVPILAGIAYSIVYAIDPLIVKPFAGDVPAVLCLAMVAAFEACIRSGLIASNSHYDEIFRASTIAAQITDDAYRVILSANTDWRIPPDVMRQAEASPVLLPGNIRLSSAPIAGGHVLWSEDVSELLDVIAELEDLDEDLQSRHAVLAEEYQTEHTRQQLAEKNRLYNQMQTHTKPQTERLAALVRAFESTSDAQQVRTLALQMAVITAYLKRRNNLIFMAQDLTAIAACELEYCLKESLQSLRLCGAQCALHMACGDTLCMENITALYDAFESLAEAVSDTLREMYVSVYDGEEKIVLCANVVCSADLSAFGGIREDEEEWTVEFCVPKGGDAP
ncbi:MAG: histidine kinase N-terminal 7TM domain-containing protein [Acutalibacteraceae bacterium]